MLVPNTQPIPEFRNSLNTVNRELQTIFLDVPRKCLVKISRHLAISIGVRLDLRGLRLDHVYSKYLVHFSAHIILIVINTSGEPLLHILLLFTLFGVLKIATFISLFRLYMLFLSIEFANHVEEIV